MTEWRTEIVPPPEQFKLPKDDKYRENYDRIFRKPEEPKTVGEQDDD